MSSSIQTQIALIKQASETLQNASNYLDMISGDQIQSPECEQLITAIKEHIKISWIIQTQVYVFPSPVLARAPAPHHHQDQQSEDEPIIADAEWPGYIPRSVEMDVSDCDDDNDNSNDNDNGNDDDDLPPMPVLMRRMTSNNLDDSIPSLLPTLSRQSSNYPLPRFGLNDRMLPIMQREDSAMTTLAKQSSFYPLPPSSLQEYSRTT